MRWLHALGHALAISGSMTWEILLALILGFALSAVVQAAVRRSTIIRRLRDGAAIGSEPEICPVAVIVSARWWPSGVPWAG
jgi:uncharacterized protein